HKVFDGMSMNKFVEKYGTVKEYFDSFNSLFSKIAFDEWYLVDLFICRLPPDIGKRVSLFQPKTLMDAYSLAKFKEREFTSFSLPQPSNATSKIMNNSLEGNGNPDGKIEYDFGDSTLVKMEKVCEKTKTSMENSQEVRIENIGVKNYEECGKENAKVKGKENVNAKVKEVKCVDLILSDESFKEDVKCKKNEYFGLNGVNEFVCKNDEIEEGIDLGRL
nr:chloroplast protease [Tanacetum cinerariifolium]